MRAAVPAFALAALLAAPAARAEEHGARGGSPVPRGGTSIVRPNPGPGVFHPPTAAPKGPGQGEAHAPIGGPGRAAVIVGRGGPGCRVYPPGLIPVGGFLPGGGWVGGAGGPPPNLRFEFEPPTLRGGDMADLYLDEDQTMNLLVDPLFTEDGRRSLEDEIVDHEMGSLPMLLSHFADPRPIPGSGSIADEMQYLFFRIVTGDYRSPHAPKGAEATRSIFTIKDLEGWWNKNRDRPIEDIQEDMAKVVDRYWTSGQKTQEL